MSLKDAIAQHSYRAFDSCPLSRIIERLSKEDKEALEQAIKNNVAVYSIARALRSEGHRIAESSVSDHAKKVCRCFKK